MESTSNDTRQLRFDENSAGDAGRTVIEKRLGQVFLGSFVTVSTTAAAFWWRQREGKRNNHRCWWGNTRSLFPTPRQEAARCHFAEGWQSAWDREKARRWLKSKHDRALSGSTCHTEGNTDRERQGRVQPAAGLSRWELAQCCLL